VPSVRKVVGIAVVAASAAAAGLYAVGAALPSGHVATEVATVPAPPDVVWARIVDFDRQEEWRSTVEDVRVVDDRFEETDAWGDVMALGVDERVEGERIVLRILGDGAFGGTWTIAVAPDGAGARVEVTERGEIRPPPLRVLAALLFDPHETARTWLADLRRSFPDG
jgi:hypothetical protein